MINQIMLKGVNINIWWEGDRFKVTRHDRDMVLNRMVMNNYRFKEEVMKLKSLKISLIYVFR